MTRFPRLAPLVLLAALPVVGQEAEVPAPPPVTVESVRIEPARPAADTLCKLFVEIANTGDEIATQLGFEVRLNGQPIDVYETQLYMFPVPAGETKELQLFNFWTTETGRPAPANGKLEVEVELLEARWVEISDQEGVEVWDPIGPVPGLPSSAKLELELAAVASDSAAEN